MAIRTRLLAAFLALEVNWVLAAGVPDFCFLHTSDNHISPQPIGAPPPSADDKAAARFRWLCAEAAKPQVITSLNLTTPPPAFVIDTGDITEYGVIGGTWSNVESIISRSPVPFYVSPGNHDYTWTGMMPIMRKRYGGDHYSFDRFGCHFACIVTATPQEPVSSIDQRTLTWLADDLRRVPAHMPVFLFCHHPLVTAEFAKPYEQLRLLQTIAGHNIVLHLMGHGHGHRHEEWNGVDSVMGGSTSHPRDNLGYNIVSVKDGTLRVAFRYHDPAKPMEVTLEKPLAPTSLPRVGFKWPKPPRDALELPIAVCVSGGTPAKVEATLDGDESTRVALSPSGTPGTFTGRINTASLLLGRHYVLATATFGARKIDAAAGCRITFPDVRVDASEAFLGAGVKAEPLIVGDQCLVATTAGHLGYSDFRKTGFRKIFDAGAEILHRPALVDDDLYLSAAEKGVHRLSREGKRRWICDVGAAVYGTPAVGPDRVYVADMEGKVHAIGRADGKLIWSRHQATYSVEMPIVFREGILYFGAWDGLLYAVNAADGSLKWKKPGPAGHRKEAIYKSRYYAPADCPPVLIGDRLFVTDRAYVLGSFRLSDGEYLGEITAKISAIGAAADGKGFYARGLEKGLTRYDAQGKAVWRNKELAMGRFPAPPTEVADKVFTCSNRGELTVHDAATGSLLLRYQASPQLHVMAPVAGDALGRAYVAGMDGVVSRIAPPMR